jgi:hypothetical protein
VRDAERGHHRDAEAGELAAVPSAKTNGSCTIGVEIISSCLPIDVELRPHHDGRAVGARRLELDGHGAAARIHLDRRDVPGRTNASRSPGSSCCQRDPSTKTFTQPARPAVRVGVIDIRPSFPARGRRRRGEQVGELGRLAAPRSVGVMKYRSTRPSCVRPADALEP